MQRTLLSKAAGMIAVLMIASMLAPVLASAQIWYNSDFTYNNGKISGTVISDTYSPNPISFKVTNDQGADIGVVQAVYDPSVTNDTYYTYDITNQSVTSDTYDYVKLTSVADSSYGINTVTNTVYHASRGCSYCGGGGGGGWGYIPPGNDGTVNANSDGHVDANALEQALAANTNVTIKITGTEAILPASALESAQDGAVVTVENDNGSYQLPLSVLHLKDLADQLGVDVDQMNIHVFIKQVSDSTKTDVIGAATKAGAKLLGTPVEFKLTAESGDKTVAIVSFGNTYVTRTIDLSESVDASHTTGAIYDPNSGTVAFVPSKFTDQDGNTIASLMRNGNSIYAVVTADKSFVDLDSVPWAQKDITLLANKLIVYGESVNQFRPNWNITRAEFAALLVRSLGLDTESVAGAKSFSDVPAGQWYTKEVEIASKAGIVYGDKEADTFRPNDPVTREEMAAMIVRAMKLAGNEPTTSSADLAHALAPFKDSGQVSLWAHTEMAQAIASGIVYGESSSELLPTAKATRAESAAMIRRFLSKIGFIDN